MTFAMSSMTEKSVLRISTRRNWSGAAPRMVLMGSAIKEGSAFTDSCEQRDRRKR